MHVRNSHGATLGLVATTAFVIILIGVGLFFLYQIFGGFRELQGATDAGNLNIAKQALKIPNYLISSSDPYQLDFTGLQDTNGVDLQVYDRMVGQAYLVGLNAQADRPQGNPGGSPSQAGLSDADIVADTANQGYNGNQGIGAQLYSLFNNHSAGNQLFGGGGGSDLFGSIADSNSTRMLGSDGQVQNNYQSYDIAFMGVGDPTNVYVDTTILPYIGDTGTPAGSPGSPLYAGIQSNLDTVNGTSYLKGYVNLTGSMPGAALYGVPVYPGNQPHHVAGRDFYAAKAANDATFAPGGQGIVPPNAFKSAASSANKTSANQAQMEAYSIVGSQQTTYQAAIPNGYIVLYNPKGTLANYTTLPDSVYNNELMPPGIFIAQTTSGQAVFTTDQNNLDAWAKYNQSVANGGNPSKPSTTDSNGNSIENFTSGSDTPTNIAFDSNGNPIPYQGTTNCQWMDVSGPTASSPCQNLLSNFESAYPTTPIPAPPTGNNPQLMAVELYKQTVINNFNSHPIPLNCPASGAGSNPSGLRFWVQPGNSKVPNSGAVGTQARTVDNPVPGPYNGAASTYTSTVNVGSNSGSPYTVHMCQISVDGTIAQLLSEVYNLDTPGGNLTPADITALSTSIPIMQIAQRMHEIDPTTTASQANNWLLSSQTPIPMDSTFYIWHQSATPGIAGWQLTNTAPPGLHGTLVPTTPGFGASSLPDGSLQTYASGPYTTVGYLVDPPFEYNIHEQAYTIVNGAATPTPGVGTGVDGAYWQPSSGYRNELGQLTFVNFCGGSLANNPPGGTFDAPD